MTIHSQKNDVTLDLRPPRRTETFYTSYMNDSLGHLGMSAASGAKLITGLHRV